MLIFEFPHLTVWLFCKRRLFWIFGQSGGFSKKPMIKIGDFALRKKGSKKTRMTKRASKSVTKTRELIFISKSLNMNS